MKTMRLPKTRSSRRALATQAMRAAMKTRAKAGLDQHSPICIYRLCEVLGVTVRFNNINMEGMYQRGAPPRIHLSALRPLPRRTYNCAHELGHHVFGHGSSIDELREDAKQHPWEDEKEFLADTFAGCMLMPVTGLRRAFATRGWTPKTATPAQLFTVACDFGVGYGTLLTHLSVGVHMISQSRAAALRRVIPKALRARLLGALTPEPLLLTDHHRAAPTLDAEVNTLLLLPLGSQIQGENLVHERDLVNGSLFRAVRPGIVQAKDAMDSWAFFVRVAPESYVGLAQYRHLEDEADE